MKATNCLIPLILAICLGVAGLPDDCHGHVEIGLAGLYDSGGNGDMTGELSFSAPLFLGFWGRVAGGITADSFDALKEDPFDRYQFLLSVETCPRLNRLLALYAGGGFGLYRGKYTIIECYEEIPGQEECWSYVEKYDYNSPHLYGGVEFDLGLPVCLRAGARWLVDEGPLGDGTVIYEGCVVFEIGNGDSPDDTPPYTIYGEELEGNGEWNAYVFIGSTKGAADVYRSAIENAADEAQSDFEDAGYNVIPNYHARYTDFKTVMDDACAKAFWFAGHGVEDDDKAPLPIIKDVRGEGITPTTKYFPSEASVLFTKANLNQVTMHACKQDLPEWRAAFPGATYDSWNIKPIGPWMYWWQLGATYPEIDQETGQELWKKAPQGIAPIRPDTYFGPKPIGQGVSDCGCEDEVCDAGFPSDGARVDDPEFGEQSFNFYVSNYDFSHVHLVLSAEVKNGTIDKSSVSDKPKDASFDVTMTYGAVKRSIEDKHAFERLVREGEVRINSRVSEPSEGVLLMGFGQLLFLTNID